MKNIKHYTLFRIKQRKQKSYKNEEIIVFLWRKKTWAYNEVLYRKPYAKWTSTRKSCWRERCLKCWLYRVRQVGERYCLSSISLCANCISQFRCLSDRCLFLCRFIIWQKLGNVIKVAKQPYFWRFVSVSNFI